MTNHDNATTLILLRHGETEWNLSGRWQGQAMDTDLSDRGREQARIVAQRLQTYPFGAIYSSDLKRAWDTACIVGDQVGMQPVADAALRESDIGVWTGMTWEEILARFPDEMAAMMAGEDIRRGGGESMSELTSRLAAAVERIAAAHP
ncbi:MAG: histidine phosphatase family protein, partial [Anaerolineae bacterium]|nr:histidine phosphatase family protein [Anaerolineae bacterium]